MTIDVRAGGLLADRSHHDLGRAGEGCSTSHRGASHCRAWRGARRLRPRGVWQPAPHAAPGAAGDGRPFTSARRWRRAASIASRRARSAMPWSGVARGVGAPASSPRRRRAQHETARGRAHAAGMGRGPAVPLGRNRRLAGRTPPRALSAAGGVRQHVGRRGRGVPVVRRTARPHLGTLPLLDQGHDLRRRLRRRRPRAHPLRGGRLSQPAQPLRHRPRRADGARHVRPADEASDLADRVGVPHDLHGARRLDAHRRHARGWPRATSR